MEPQQNPKSILSLIQKPPRIKRQYLRKYSWLPDVFRVKGSIIPRISGPVLTVTIFSAVVAFARSRGTRIELSNSVIPLLSVVVGLILVFRNSTSYDRYWEGRKCFSTLTANVRNLSRMIWVHVTLPPTMDNATYTQSKNPSSQLTPQELKHQKVEALRYCIGFVYAVKHYLRGEDGAHHADLAAILPSHFSRSRASGHTTNIPTSSLGIAPLNNDTNGKHSADATKRVRRKRSKKNLDPQSHAADSTTPLLNHSHLSVEFHPHAPSVSIPLPLIVAHEISRVVFKFRREGLLETVGPAGTNAMNGLIQSMVEQMTSMERVANTPIPSSYGIHLKQCVTLYLFALPLTLMNDLGWSTIPIVTVVAFTLMGIEGIADEIEMPFGSDLYDLPLETYCDDLKEEIEYMIERLPEGGYGINDYDDGEGDD